jgi:hypothetical protein
MALQVVNYPLIQGNYYDFSSVEFSVPGYPASPPYGGVLAVQSIDYTDSLEAKVEATNIIAVMATFGSALAKPQGYLEYGGLTITVNYYEPTMQALVTDTLIGFRFGKMADSHKTGQDVLMVDLDFKLLMLVRNGQYPYDPQNLGIAFPTA